MRHQVPMPPTTPLLLQHQGRALLSRCTSSHTASTAHLLMCPRIPSLCSSPSLAQPCWRQHRRSQCMPGQAPWDHHQARLANGRSRGLLHLHHPHLAHHPCLHQGQPTLTYRGSSSSITISSSRHHNPGTASCNSTRAIAPCHHPMPRHLSSTSTRPWTMALVLVASPAAVTATTRLLCGRSLHRQHTATAAGLLTIFAAQRRTGSLSRRPLCMVLPGGTRTNHHLHHRPGISLLTMARLVIDSGCHRAAWWSWMLTGRWRWVLHVFPCLMQIGPGTCVELLDCC
mmetsp:Transcript_11426/g.27950  ORF Transcript_11426/g.27950 Transcript_11426/m.27950 type:complete len:285 (+) Transcript_11426:265-1119(+)